MYQNLSSDRSNNFSSRLLDAALCIVEKLKEPQRSEALIIIASVYDKLGFRDLVLEILDLILESLGLIESDENQIHILFQIERLYSDYYRTLDIIELVNKYFNFIENAKLKTDLLRQLAHLYIALGRCDRAELTLQDALLSIEKIKNPREYSETLIDLEKDFAVVGLDKKMFLEQAIEYALEIMDYRVRVDTLMSLGLSFARAGLYKEAMKVDSIIESDHTPDDWILYTNLSEKLIYYYIYENEQPEIIKYILENKFFNGYRFGKLCRVAVKYYADKQSFDEAWQIIEILEKNIIDADYLYKSEALAYLAEKYFQIEKDREALSLLVRAINIANFVNDGTTKISVLRQIAKVYIEADYQNIAEKLLPSQLVAGEYNLQKNMKQQEYSHKHLKEERAILIDNFYDRCIDLKKYKEALAILKKEYSNFEKIQKLTELALKYTTAPSFIDKETEEILKEIIANY